MTTDANMKRAGALLSGTVSLEDIVAAIRADGDEASAKRLEVVIDGMRANRQRTTKEQG